MKDPLGHKVLQVENMPETATQLKKRLFLMENEKPFKELSQESRVEPRGKQRTGEQVQGAEWIP